LKKNKKRKVKPAKKINPLTNKAFSVEEEKKAKFRSKINGKNAINHRYTFMALFI
jgi:hypothetical protein